MDFLCVHQGTLFHKYLLCADSLDFIYAVMFHLLTDGRRQILALRIQLDRYQCFLEILETHFDGGGPINKLW